MPNQTDGAAAERLQSFIERIERLEEEKKNLTADIREVYAEAKSSGFDTKTMRKVVAVRKLDESERQEQEALFDTYMRALGYDETPLGKAAEDASVTVTAVVPKGKGAKKNPSEQVTH